MVLRPASGYPERTRTLEKTAVVDFWIIAGILLVVVAGVMAIVAARRSGTPEASAVVEIDEVTLLKERVQLHRALEEDLVAAGQALGRVRRFMIDPDEAGPLVDELRERLTDLWLRRFDYEGRLRMAALRRRVPMPPAMEQFGLPLDSAAADHLVGLLDELARDFRELAVRAEDSARMLRRLPPEEDPHARWVGDAVEVAQEWRLAQTEEIQRFAGKVHLQADQLDEFAIQIHEAMQSALAENAAGLPPTLVEVELPGMLERLRWLSRVGLAEAREREIVPESEQESDAERAVRDARATAVDVRELARRAGATRSTRAPSPLPGDTETPAASG
ncbi:MAG: hypothetical protein CL927_00805 [Deltaproteobacteria bacterium]|nr:hypothetical protein [Deltaproteobacteria bacterium]HCH64695.1 hypothetical protein [Deltaproteobacteria bacterium]